MTTVTVQRATNLLGTINLNATAHKRRDLKTVINHADEEAYKKQLEPLGGKEDMWQGGDVYVSNQSSLISLVRTNTDDLIFRYYPNPPKMSVNVTVEDIGGRESEFTLEKNGFMMAKQQTKVMLETEDLINDEKITKEYYPEMEQWLKEV
jgi:hypothetical protein